MLELVQAAQLQYPQTLPCAEWARRVSEWI